MLQGRQITEDVDGSQNLCKKTQPPIATKGKLNHICRVSETESATLHMLTACCDAFASGDIALCRNRVAMYWHTSRATGAAACHGTA